MMTNSPTPQQTLLLWRILAVAGASGEVMQKDLGIEVDRKDREKLVLIGLLEVAKVKNGAWKLTVTDAGWGWADEHLDAEMPARASARISPLLHRWLTLFHGHLRRTGASLADVFTASPPVEESLAPGKNGARPYLQDVQSQVRAAYLSLTGGHLKTRCLLRELRDELPEITRDRMDQAIQSMVALGDAILFRLDNRIEVTPADTAASIFAGGEQQHILWIDR